jgi:hypothetical protein
MNLADSSLAKSGAKSVSFVPQAFEALFFALSSGTFSTSSYSGLEFYINGSPNGNCSLPLTIIHPFNLKDRWSTDPSWIPKSQGLRVRNSNLREYQQLHRWCYEHRKCMATSVRTIFSHEHRCW